jgi:hypothetical protein
MVVRRFGRYVQTGSIVVIQFPGAIETTPGSLLGMYLPSSTPFTGVVRDVSNRSVQVIM